MAAMFAVVLVADVVCYYSSVFIVIIIICNLLPFISIVLVHEFEWENTASLFYLNFP